MRDHDLQEVDQDITLDVVTTQCSRGIYKDKGINFLLAWSELTVNNGRPNGKGIYDSIGNVWEWIESYASALNDFEPHPLYEDFSTPCFDGKHC